MDEFQKIRGVILGKLKEKPFIQDQQCRVGVLLQYISESACVFGRFEVDEQIRHSDVLHSVIVFAGFHSEGTGHVGLSTAGRAGDKDVPVLCDVLTGRQPLNERSVQLAVVPIIDIGNRSIRLLKLGFPDQPLQPVVLACSVFSIDEHSETVLKGDLLHGWVILLDAECVGHRCHMHLNKLVNRTLVGHDLLPP